MEKVDNLQKEVANVRRKMEILRKNPKDILDIKNSYRDKEFYWWKEKRIPKNCEITTKGLTYI